MFKLTLTVENCSMRNIYISKLHSFIVGMLSGYIKIAKSQKYMYAYCTKVGHSCYEKKKKKNLLCFLI